MPFNFDPATFLRERNVQEPFGTTALIVLNRPISNRTILRKLWKHSAYNVAADGGANHLRALHEANSGRPDFLPDVVHGDLDSLTDDGRAYFESHGVCISKDPDQYSTDFGKAIKKIRTVAQERGARRTDIIVIGSLSGRVDQGIGMLHEVYREFKASPDCRFWLFSEQSVSFVLPKGANTIATDLSEGILTRNVGILPVFVPSIISTEGLEWDVTDWETAMGAQVSTSNHVGEKVVSVRTTEPVLFTIELVLPDDE